MAANIVIFKKYYRIQFGQKNLIFFQFWYRYGDQSINLGEIGRLFDLIYPRTLSLLF